VSSSFYFNFGFMDGLMATKLSGYDYYRRVVMRSMVDDGALSNAVS
jgi:hypothetical protein